MFVGTYASLNGVTEQTAKAFMRALGSGMVFDNGTIDQPGKPMSFALHGVWLAGPPPMSEWDALLLVGTNPVISMNGALGVNPARNLKKMRDRGMGLVVIDPRLTECARRADVHLQIRPATDALVLSCLVRLLLEQNLIDDQFVASETQGINSLRQAVDPFTPQFVAKHAGVAEADLRRVARILGSARRGAISVGTGGNMSGQSTLVEYLGRALTSLRGWWLRAGEERVNPGVLVEPFPAIAGTLGPSPYDDLGEVMRVRNLKQSVAGPPTAALAEEILTPGEGQVKALIVIGGNPVLAWPDQELTVKALKSLELLITIDPRMTETAEMSHWVFAPKMALECENNSAVNERWRIVGPGWGYEVPYAQVTPPVVAPPVGSELREDWEFIYQIARHMELQLEIQPHVIFDPSRAAAMATMVDMKQQPTTQDMWRMVLKGSPVPYDEVRESPDGRIFPRPKEIVQPKPADWHGRLELAAPLILSLLEKLATETGESPHENSFPFRLISRRLNDVINSCGHDNPAQLRKWPYNPAFIHPDDMAALHIDEGALVEIRSQRAAIFGIAHSAPELRPGCISMAHSWGRHPDKEQRPALDGANTGRLVANDRDFDPVTGLPLMSAIPVSVRVAAHAPSPSVRRAIAEIRP